jgi:hypothetical protein
MNDKEKDSFQRRFLSKEVDASIKIVHSHKILPHPVTGLLVGNRELLRRVALEIYGLVRP